MNEQLTFNSETKRKWVATMQAHQDADRLQQGNWWDDGKGCFFGCAMKTNNNALEKAIEAMNLPAWLVYLAENIFEGLTKEDSDLFPVQLLNAIPEDADISAVKHKLAILRLTRLADNNPSVEDVIDNVVNCHKQAINDVANINWSAARSAAWSAARSTAWKLERDDLVSLLTNF